MSDFDDRFRELDSAPAPQLWRQIRDREPGELPPGRSGAKAAVASIAAILVMVGAIAGLAVGFSGSDPAPSPTDFASGPTPSSSESGSPEPSTPQSVSGTNDDGTLRCTATVASTEVAPGESLEVTFTMENLGTKPFRYSRWEMEGGLIAVLAHPDSGSAIQVWDERADTGPPHSMPAPVPTLLAPGDSARTHTSSVRVRWNGPLEVTPVCDYGVGQLEPMTVHVVTTGPAPTPDEAVRRLLSALAPAFDRCAPGPDGAEVTGWIDPPEGPEAPAPMTARCSATVEELEGFDVVTFRFVSPSDGAEIDLLSDEGFQMPPGEGPYEAGAWTFVVSADTVSAVDPARTVSRTVVADAMAPEFRFDGPGTGFVTLGTSRCGGEFFASGPVLQFGTVCEP